MLAFSDDASKASRLLGGDPGYPPLFTPALDTTLSTLDLVEFGREARHIAIYIGTVQSLLFDEKYVTKARRRRRGVDSN